MPYTSDGEFYTADDVLDGADLAAYRREHPQAYRAAEQFGSGYQDQHGHSIGDEFPAPDPATCEHPNGFRRAYVFPHRTFPACCILCGFQPDPNDERIRS